MARAFLCFGVVMVVLGVSEAGLLGVSHSHSSQNSPDPRAQDGQNLLNLGFARTASPSGRPGQAMTRPMLDMQGARAREVKEHQHLFAGGSPNSRHPREGHPTIAIAQLLGRDEPGQMKRGPVTGLSKRQIAYQKAMVGEDGKEKAKEEISKAVGTLMNMQMEIEEKKSTGDDPAEKKDDKPNSAPVNNEQKLNKILSDFGVKQRALDLAKGVAGRYRTLRANSTSASTSYGPPRNSTMFAPHAFAAVDNNMPVLKTSDSGASPSDPTQSSSIVSSLKEKLSSVFSTSKGSKESDKSSDPKEKDSASPTQEKDSVSPKTQNDERKKANSSSTQVGEKDAESAGLKESERESGSEAKNVQGARGRESEKTGGEGVKEGTFKAPASTTSSSVLGKVLSGFNANGDIEKSEKEVGVVQPAAKTDHALSSASSERPENKSNDSSKVEGDEEGDDEGDEEGDEDEGEQDEKKEGKPDE